MTREFGMVLEGAIVALLIWQTIAFHLFYKEQRRADERISELEKLIDEHNEKLDELEPQDNFGIFGMQDKDKWES